MSTSRSPMQASRTSLRHEVVPIEDLEGAVVDLAFRPLEDRDRVVVGVFLAQATVQEVTHDVVFGAGVAAVGNAKAELLGEEPVGAFEVGNA